MTVPVNTNCARSKPSAGEISWHEQARASPAPHAQKLANPRNMTRYFIPRPPTIHLAWILQVVPGPNRRPSILPRLCLLKRGGEPKQHGFLAVSGHELHSHGKPGAVLLQWQRNRRLTGRVEEGSERRVGEDLPDPLLGGQIHRVAIEKCSANRKRALSDGWRQQNVVRVEKSGDVTRNPVHDVVGPIKIHSAQRLSVFKAGKAACL